MEGHVSGPGQGYRIWQMLPLRSALSQTSHCPDSIPLLAGTHQKPVCGALHDLLGLLPEVVLHKLAERLLQCRITWIGEDCWSFITYTVVAYILGEIYSASKPLQRRNCSTNMILRIMPLQGNGWWWFSASPVVLTGPSGIWGVLGTLLIICRALHNWK